jgi:hypothetical protein
MSLTYCEGCNQLEGDTIEQDEETVCAQCLEPVTGVPEHDDYDMER